MTTRVEKQVEEFFNRYKLRKFEKNVILLHPGDRPKNIMFLVSGHIRQYDISNQGDKVVVNVFRKTAFIPMSWAINKTSSHFFYETATEVELRQAPTGKVLRFVKDNPRVTFDLLSRVYLGTEIIIRRMAHAMGGSARTRLLYELLLEARRFGEKQSDGSLVVPMHVYELAARTGLTRETASRELAKLRKLGIGRSGHNITVDKISLLEKALGADL